jgi:hypothetical protein
MSELKALEGLGSLWVARTKTPKMIRARKRAKAARKTRKHNTRTGK